MARKTVQCWHVLAQWMEWVLVFLLEQFRMSFII